MNLGFVLFLSCILLAPFAAIVDKHDDQPLSTWIVVGTTLQVAALVMICLYLITGYPDIVNFFIWTFYFVGNILTMIGLFYSNSSLYLVMGANVFCMFQVTQGI
jgi:hypothetical protein